MVYFLIPCKVLLDQLEKFFRDRKGQCACVLHCVVPSFLIFKMFVDDLLQREGHRPSSGFHFAAESGMQLCRDLPAYGFLLHVAASLYFFAFPLAATQAYTKASGIAITKSNNVLPLFFELYVTTNNGEPVHFRIRHFLYFNVPGRLSSCASSGQSAPYPQKSIAPTHTSCENLCPPACPLR